MSFKIKWPEFSDQFIEKAKEQLTIALNKGQKPANIVDRIVVTALNMGTVPPDIELLEIGELSDTKFRGILKIQYCGNGLLVLQTKVQANPLTTTQHALLITPHQGYLAAHQPLVVPMQLKISQLNIRGIFVLVIDKFAGITVSFKNDPLESVHVSSTFDNVLNIRHFLQGLIERELRQLLQETLPLLVHTMSLRYIHCRYRGSEHGAGSLARRSDELDAASVRAEAEPPNNRAQKWLGNEDYFMNHHSQLSFGHASAGSPWERNYDMDGDSFLSDRVYIHRRPLGIRTEYPVLGASASAAAPSSFSGARRRPAPSGLHDLFDPEPVIPSAVMRHQVLDRKSNNYVTQSDIFDREMERNRLLNFRSGASSAGGVNLERSTHLPRPPPIRGFANASGSALPSLRARDGDERWPLRTDARETASEAGHQMEPRRHKNRLVLSNTQSPKVVTKLHNLVNAHRTISPYVHGWEGEHFVFRSSPLRLPAQVADTQNHSPTFDPASRGQLAPPVPPPLTKRSMSYQGPKTDSTSLMSRAVGSALPSVPIQKPRKLKIIDLKI